MINKFIDSQPSDITVTLLRLTLTAIFYRLADIANSLSYLISVLGTGEPG